MSETADWQWQAMVDAVPAAILYLDTGGAICRANRTAREWIGDCASLTELAREEPWLTAYRLCEMVEATGADDFMEAIEPATGTVWEITASQLRAAESSGGLVLVLAEVTERVRLAEKLRRRDRLSMLGTLVYGISHKVRSSLFGITGLIDVLESRIGSNPEIDSFLDMQRLQSQLIVDVIDRVLQYAGPTEPNPTPGGLAAVIEAGIAEARSRAPSPDIAIHLELDPGLPILTLDRDRVTNAIGHIVQNALEHSPARGTVRVKAKVLRHEELDVVRVDIEDDGDGISEKVLAKAFEPFFSGHGSEGHGLGLPIARRVIEDHGGRVEIANPQTGGCRVSVTLPVIHRPYRNGQETS